MKKTIIGLLLSFVVMTANAQWTNTGNNTTTGQVKAKEYSFDRINYDFSKMPRTQISPMSIKLFDDYYSQRPGGTSPDNNAFGTLLAMYGLSNHWESNIYFGAQTNKMYFRTSKYATHTAENGVVGDFNEWRTLLDNKSDIKTSGLLKLEATGNHYISKGYLGIGLTEPKAGLHIANSYRAIIAEGLLYLKNVNAPTDKKNWYFGVTDGGDFGLYVAKDSYSWEKTILNFNRDTGNVGIGTSTPASKLEVNGDISLVRSKKIKFLETVGGDDRAYIKSTNCGVDEGCNDLIFAVGPGNETLFLKSNGNVGIGTDDTNNYKLAVAGSTGIIAEKVTVKLATQWPDYVFTKDYELPSLKEVEQQIKEKGHLANIPSAIEVKENGIELGDMNKKLLEKIEELTLYTIQQEKELIDLQSQKELVKKLSKENEALKNRLTKIETFLETLK